MSNSNHTGNDRETLFSIVIPARNEEKCLPQCLQAIKAAEELLLAQEPSTQHTKIQVIVVVNRSTDRTEEIARAGGCVVAVNDSKNLSQIRNSGAALAQGAYLITVDADSRMSENMLLSIFQKLQNPKIVGGGVAIIPERLSLGIFCTGLVLLPIVLWHRISAGLFFCRLADFNAIGGFDEQLSSIEDIDFARRLRLYAKKNGRRFITLFRAHIVTSCRKFDHFGDWFFIKNPRMSLKLLKGRHQAHADTVWYDFKH